MLCNMLEIFNSLQVTASCHNKNIVILKLLSLLVKKTKTVDFKQKGLLKWLS